MNLVKKYLGYIILLGGIVCIGIVAMNSPTWARNLLLAGVTASLVGGFWVHKVSGQATEKPPMA